MSNRIVRSVSGSRMNVLGMANLSRSFFSHGEVTPVRLHDVLLGSSYADPVFVVSLG